MTASFSTIKRKRINTTSVILFALFLLLFQVKTISAQNPLEKRISIYAENEQISSILQQLERSTGFVFSYNSALINDSKTMSLSATNLTMKDILDQMFNKKIEYRIVNKHIILIEAQSPKQKQKSILLTGQIIDERHQPLKSAILYAVEGNVTTISADNGNFQLSMTPSKPVISISISHPSCIDTIVCISASNQTLNIKLHQIKREVTTKSELMEIPSEYATPAKFESKSVVELLVPNKSLYVTENLKVYNNFQTVQLSFLPFIGTNFISKGITSNKMSFNILAGYSNGVSGLELGGIANIVKNDVEGVQMAGIANIVGGTITGTQMAGIVNMSGKTMNGAQLAGIASLASNGASGMQASGLFSIVKGKPNCTQISGLANLVVNDQGTSAETDTCNNMQISGLVNVGSQKTTQFQFGLANFKSSPNGLQIGLFNHTDSLNNGFQFGMINIAKHAPYKVWGIQSNEIARVNFMYKSGNRHIYNILGASFGGIMGVGCGLGITTNFEKRLSLYAEATAHSIMKIVNEDAQTGSMGRLQLGTNIRFAKHFSLTLGPSISLFIPNYEDETTPFELKMDYNFHGNRDIISDAFANKQSLGWLGWFAGIQF